MKINLMNDYNSACHPTVAKAVIKAAEDGTRYPGYGTDDETERAKYAVMKLLGSSDRNCCGCDEVLFGTRGWKPDVHFLTGGTQTNLTAICAFLRPHEAVIAAFSSHINQHETGAIEAAGHKIIFAKQDTRTDRTSDSDKVNATGANEGNSAGSGEGKISADAIREVCESHCDEHTVMPRLVFISQSTEMGGVYGLSELKEIRKVCDELSLLLYIDGARLAVALTSPGNDAGFSDIAALADAFYIGGTKNGLLFGEALVIMNPELARDFRYIIKQRGGLLAKGFLLGIQFNALFRDNLYLNIARHANEKAAKIRDGLEKLGCRFLAESMTNQIFPIFKNETVDTLLEDFEFEVWGSVSRSEKAVRFVTAWNTTDDDVNALIAACSKNILRDNSLTK